MNIGYSCHLLTDEMEEIYVVDGDTSEEVQEQLSNALNQIKSMMDKYNPDKVAYQNGGYISHGEDFGLEEAGGYALVINGSSLVGETHWPVPPHVRIVAQLSFIP